MAATFRSVRVSMMWRIGRHEYASDPKVNGITIRIPHHAGTMTAWWASVSHSMLMSLAKNDTDEPSPVSNSTQTNDRKSVLTATGNKNTMSLDGVTGRGRVRVGSGFCFFT